MKVVKEKHFHAFLKPQQITTMWLDYTSNPYSLLLIYSGIKKENYLEFMYNII